jgi:hypothetical protein
MPHVWGEVSVLARKILMQNGVTQKVKNAAVDRARDGWGKVWEELCHQDTPFEILFYRIP